MKNELIIASHSESANRALLVSATKGQYSYRRLSSESASIANPDVTNVFPFIFDSHEGGQFFVILDINVNFTAPNIEQLQILLHTYSGTTHYSTVWSQIVPVNPITGAPINSSLTSAHLEFSILLEPNQGFTLALGHNHFKSVVFILESFSIKVYKSYPDAPETTTGITRDDVRDMLSDVMTRQEFVNSDNSVGKQSDKDFSSLLRIPQQFPPEEHNHDDRYSTKEEVNADVRRLSEDLNILSLTSHSHPNKEVLDHFTEKGGLLHFRGKRFDDYFLYINSGGLSSYKTDWAECSLDWNTLQIDNTYDFNSSLKDHGRLLYTDFQHGLAVLDKRNIQLYLEFCYYDPNESNLALRYKLTNHSSEPIVYPLDDYTVRIVCRDHGRQPSGSTNNFYNTGRGLLPCYRVTASRLLDTSGQRPVYHFLGCLRQLPNI
jgi:hypothetical protein